MRSWVESANIDGCDFPLQNLPYGVARSNRAQARCVVAIGDQVLDLAVLQEAGHLGDDLEPAVFAQPSLNGFMALGPCAWKSTRSRLTALLADDGDPALRSDERLHRRALSPMASEALELPFEVTEYTDFYAGRQHAYNVGCLLRGPDNALPANWDHIPIGYNGRASTVVVSGTPIRRPMGQLCPTPGAAPVFGPSARLDIELELGAVVGVGSAMGDRLSVSEARESLFGYVLLNDWSARDIQAWEYQPLGPFQAKAFGTTVSPWVVTSEALEPFTVPPPRREVPLLPYLRDAEPAHHDILLEVYLKPASAPSPTRVARTSTRHLYYSAAQQLAHHSVGGCRMRTGDLLGSGTISGPAPGEYGSLLELSWGGQEPIALAGGETRTFLEDGDEVTLRGWAQGAGFRVGFGECRGAVLPARG